MTDKSTNEDNAQEELIEGNEEVLETEEAEEQQEPSLEEQLVETKDQLLRALAETENTRKRAQRDKEETSQYAVTKFARDMLAVADNLSMAIASIENADNNDSMDKLLEGIKITEKELLQVFTKHKIEKIESLDQPFDPNLHQAMLEIPDSDKKPGTVVQEMQPGYTIAGRLLRPAMVGVVKS